MKISPLSATGVPTHGGAPADAPAPTMAQRIRSVRMNTNATPGRAPPQDQELTIPYKGDDSAQTADEATKPLSPQFAALAKQKRALQLERQALDREKAEFTQTSTQGAGVDLSRLKSDPLGVLLEQGVTYEQLTDAVLAHNDGVNPKVQALEAKLAALESGLDTKLKDRDAQQEQQALAEMRREALQLSAEGEDFEMVRETKSIPHVMTLIERTYRETGEVLAVREALRLVEDELVKDALKLAGHQKVQSQLAPRPSPQPLQQPRQMRTLTNRDTAQVPMTAKQRALAAFHGTLPKR